MTTLPISAFPIAGNATKSSGFVLAVVVGLALFMAAQSNKPKNQQK